MNNRKFTHIKSQIYTYQITTNHGRLAATQLNVNLRTQVKHLIVRIYLSKLNTKLYVTYYSYWSISNSG